MRRVRCLQAEGMRFKVGAGCVRMRQVHCAQQHNDVTWRRIFPAQRRDNNLSTRRNKQFFFFIRDTTHHCAASTTSLTYSNLSLRSFKSVTITFSTPKLPQSTYPHLILFNGSTQHSWPDCRCRWQCPSCNALRCSSCSNFCRGRVESASRPDLVVGALSAFPSGGSSAPWKCAQ